MVLEANRAGWDILEQVSSFCPYTSASSDRRRDGSSSESFIYTVKLKSYCDLTGQLGSLRKS